MWRLIYSIPMWILFIMMRTVLILIGWIIVPIAAALELYEVRPDMLFGKLVYRHHWAWRILWLWGNDEEGISWYGDPEWPTFIRIVYSQCWRNPANNLRYVPLLSLQIDPTRVRFIGSLGDWDYKYLSETAVRSYDSDEVSFWSFTWCGAYSNFRWQFMMFGKRWRLWAGWKIYPEDIYGVTDHRKESAGFATQFKRIWPRGVVETQG